MTDILCRCPGFEGDCACEHDATQEDGLCDGCRCEHGSCVDHGHPRVSMTFEEWTARNFSVDDPAVLDAWRAWGRCRDARVTA